MKSSILYIATAIFMLVAFVQCKKTPTTSNSEPSNTQTTPKLTAPSQNTDVQGTTVQLSWEKMSDADHYQLQVSKYSDFSSTYADVTVNDTTYTVTSLSEKTTYYWRVHALKKVGKNDRIKKVGNWSKTWQFTTGSSTTTTVNLISPTDGAVVSAQSPQLEWESVAATSTYEYQISTDADFTSIVKDSVIDKTSIKTPELTDGKEYHWRVLPVVDDGSGEWSNGWSFTVDLSSSTAVVNLLSPTDGATGVSTSPSFDWESLSGISDYQLQLAETSDFSTTTIDKIIADTSYAASGLKSGQQYYWRVQADGDGDTGNWSSTYSFTTESSTDTLSAPTLVSPSDGATGVSVQPTFEWQSVSGADYYDLHVSYDNQMAIETQVTGNTYTPSSALNSGTIHYWRVRAVKDGVNGEWSVTYDFTTESSSSSSDGVTGDRQALMDLYNATDGDNWVDNTGWGSGDPSDSWYGVEVDANGRVVRLDLWDNGLQGSLPASIGNLTKVKYLNLKKNQLTGDIPSEIGNMVSLEWLLLEGKTRDNDSTGPKEPPQDLTKPYHQGKKNESTNHFTSLPSTIGNLSNLKRFELSGSGISQIPVELYNITSLEGIYMSHNYNVTHGISSTIGNLTNLQHLYMAENNMTGNLPSEMSNLTKLTYLTLGSSSQTSNENSFTGTLPDFSNLTELRQITLDKNDLEGDWPQYWNNGNFTQLITLSAGWNNFTGTLHGFNNLSSIRSLVLNGNKLTGSLDPQLTQIDQGVKIVALGWNNFSGDIPQDGYGWYYDLRNWRLNDNDLTGHIPCDMWEMLNKSDNLRRVYMNNDEFDSNATSCMEEVSSPVLETINVSGNNF